MLTPAQVQDAHDAHDARELHKECMIEVQSLEKHIQELYDSTTRCGDRLTTLQIVCEKKDKYIQSLKRIIIGQSRLILDLQEGYTPPPHLQAEQ